MHAPTGRVIHSRFYRDLTYWSDFNGPYEAENHGCLMWRFVGAPPPPLPFAYAWLCLVINSRVRWRAGIGHSNARARNAVSIYVANGMVQVHEFPPFATHRTSDGGWRLNNHIGAFICVDCVDGRPAICLLLRPRGALSWPPLSLSPIYLS